MSASSELNLPPRVRYGTEVRTTLRERARAATTTPDLREELSILRELLNDALDAYDHAVDEAYAKGLDIHRVKLAAGGLVAMAIERVEKVALTHSRVSSAKFMAMPDVNLLIEQFVGTVDSALALHAGQLRMTGLDPEQFMQDLAGRLRDVQASMEGVAMVTAGPHGYATLEEARAAANAEATAMDNTVPAWDVALHPGSEPSEEDAA